MALEILNPFLKKDKGESLHKAQIMCVPLISASPPMSFFFPQGDHGGPLVCSIRDTWYLMGVSSWGLECKEPTGISYFTKISTFVPWVNKSRSAVPVPPAEDPAQAKGGPPMVNFTISSQRSSQKAKTNTMILLLFLLLILWLYQFWRKASHLQIYLWSFWAVSLRCGTGKIKVIK